MKALTELKNHVAGLSIEMAEKIINMLPRISKMKSGTFYDLRQKQN